MFLVSTHHYYCKLIKRASDIHSLMLSSFKDNLSQENSMGTLWNLKTSQKLIYAFAFQWKMENYIVSESYYITFLGPALARWIWQTRIKRHWTGAVIVIFPIITKLNVIICRDIIAKPQVILNESVEVATQTRKLASLPIGWIGRNVYPGTLVKSNL